MARQSIPWPAAPGSSATIILAGTHPSIAVVGGLITPPPQVPLNLAQGLIEAVEFVWLRNDQASAANGIRLYALDDAGVFREVDCKNDLNAASIGSAAPQAVPVLAAGQEWRTMIDVSRYILGWAVAYTAGATGPTNWNGVSQVHHSGAEAIGR